MNRLGVRLALAIGGSIAVVIVLVGVFVNLSIASRFNAYVQDEQQNRRDELVQLVVETYRDQGSLAFGPLQMRQLAIAAGGQVRIYDAGGSLVARSVRPTLPGPPGSSPVQTISAPLVVDGQTIGHIEFDPSPVPVSVRQATSDAFRRALGTTLILAGIVAIVVTAIVALAMSLRLTRPLGAMSAAARRLGQGDLAARVPVPSDREGRDLAVAFNGMAASLERSETLRRQAASDLAHEIATPVTVLTAQLDALRDGVVPASPEQLAAAGETARDVARLVGDIDDLAAAEGAALHRSPERTDLAAFVARAAAAAMGLYAQRGVTLVTGSGAPAIAAPTLLWVEVDPRHVERILSNLLTNAAAYTPPGGRVLLSAAHEGAWVRIRVADTGPGVLPEHQAHVFERFYRADPARARTPGVPGGTGIGLTVARELARANGGDVRIESTGPSGTTFVVELPAAL